MIAVVALLLILFLFGGLGFAVHGLWVVLVVALLLWALGWFAGGPAGGPPGYWRRW